jgi:hypothetical protein
MMCYRGMETPCNYNTNAVYSETAAAVTTVNEEAWDAKMNEVSNNFAICNAAAFANGVIWGVIGTPLFGAIVGAGLAITCQKALDNTNAYLNSIKCAQYITCSADTMHAVPGYRMNCP